MSLWISLWNSGCFKIYMILQSSFIHGLHFSNLIFKVVNLHVSEKIRISYKPGTVNNLPRTLFCIIKISQYKPCTYVQTLGLDFIAGFRNCLTENLSSYLIWKIRSYKYDSTKSTKDFGRLTQSLRINHSCKNQILVNI